MKLKKKSVVALIVALALMVVSVAGTALMQSDWFHASVKTSYVSLEKLAGMIEENNAKTGKDIQVTFNRDANSRFSFMTMIPNSANNAPAPAVICIHGGANGKEMQLSNYIELVRRGFVVISMDMAGHGYSDVSVEENTGSSLGAIAAVEYAMSLPQVDATRIGVTGHSMGNQACFFAITQANGPDYPNPRIAAWVEGAGSMYAPQMTPELLDGMIWVMSIDKFDEFDTVYFGANTFMTSPLSTSIAQCGYPALTGFPEEGVFYTPDGPMPATTDGSRLNASGAMMIINPEITHPMYHFTTTGAAINIDGFYNGLGTPAGRSFMSSDKQVWPVMVVFELIGLIGFFMFMFPLVSLLSETKFFSAVKRTVTPQEKLASVKSPVEVLVWIVTIVLSVLFSFFTYIKLYPLGDSMLLDTSVYAMCGVPNSIGYWSLVCGVFAVIMILAGFAVRKLVKKDAANPFEVARLDSFGQFGKTVLFAITVICIMYIPVYLARYLFNADFRICSLVVGAVSVKKLPLIVCKYLPLWLAFYIPNAIMNANTRYKELPEWVTTVVSAVANGISLVVFVALQYGTLFSTGALWNPSCGMAGIVAWAVFPCLFFAAFSARYIYKKTGNIWIAGLINGMVMCFATTFATQYFSDLILTF